MSPAKKKSSAGGATMAEWAAQLQTLLPEHAAFADALLREEDKKVRRLYELADETGLPIYKSLRFKLHSELVAFRKACLKITKNSKWQLAIRINRVDTGKVLFRGLGISAPEALAAVKKLPKGDVCIATVTPYRTPARSGTLLVEKGRVTMEFAFGPHTILSKGSGDAENLLHCSYGPFSESIKYSTADEKIRAILFEMLKKSVQMVLGFNYKEVPKWKGAAYAEFHWHEDIGFRFIECSFSPVWSGKLKSESDSQMEPS
jgi:hypothetical protein